jgi:hypothetical protein
MEEAGGNAVSREAFVYSRICFGGFKALSYRSCRGIFSENLKFKVADSQIANPQLSQIWCRNDDTAYVAALAIRAQGADCHFAFGF